MREEIEQIFKRYDTEPTEALVDALERYVDHERFKAKHDGAMYAVDRIKASFGGDNG